MRSGHPKVTEKSSILPGCPRYLPPAGIWSRLCSAAYHKLGHSILDVTGPETARQVGKLLWGGRAMPVSILAKKDPEEYFCETFAAYRFEDGLADKDPQGYDMVEAILRMVWKK